MTLEAVEASLQQLVDQGAELVDLGQLVPHPAAVAHVVAVDDGRAYVWVRDRMEAAAAVATLDDVRRRLKRLRAHGGPPPGEPWQRSSSDLGWFLWIVEHDLPEDALTLPAGAVRGSG